MSDLTGLNTNYGLGTNNLAFGSSNIGANFGITNSTNSIFNMNNALSNNYCDDMLMNTIDFNALSQSSALGTTQTQAQAQTEATQNKTETSFTSNPQTSNENIQSKELENYLVNRDEDTEKTEAGNTYKKSGAFKFLGAIAGLLAPIGSAAIDLFKGKSFKEAFKLKQLAITCPIIALTGFGAGMLLDGLVNSGRAKAANNTSTKA
jgi:hypothetical protein